MALSSALFSSNVGGMAVDNALSVVDILIHSGDIRDQIVKLSEIASTVDYTPQLHRRERVLAMGILSVRLSVCPSITTRYGFKARRDRDSRSSPYDSLESLVSYEVIWCQWVIRFRTKECIKEGYTHLEIIILPLLAHLA